MSDRDTTIKANRQICLLMKHCTPEEADSLKKYLRRIPPRIQQRRTSEPQKLGDILPAVMADITRRVEGVLI